MQSVRTHKTCSSCGELKALGAFHALSRAKDGKQSRCKDCACSTSRNWYRDNEARVALNHAAYYQNNKATINAKNKIWAEDNPEKALGFGRKYRAGNPEKERERAKRYRSLNATSVRESQQRYHAENPELKNMWDAERRAQKKLAMPVWADRPAIAAVYREARKRTKATGISWHVDHIVPLSNKFVCGLHVAHNLQIITAVENLSKHNGFVVN